MAGSTDALTEREREVLRLLVAGHTAKSAARALDLSVHTVNDHLREARRKLGVASSREAARLLAGEETPPEKPAPDEIGIAAAPAMGQMDGEQRPGAPRRTALWIIGGFIMLASLLALALAATGTFSSGGHPVPGTANAALSQEDRAARDAALAWLALTDAGKYQDSWSTAGSNFRKAVTAASWQSQVEPVRSPLGAVVTRSLASADRTAELPGAPKSDYYMLKFSTRFANFPAATETVVMEREGEGWRVVGYFIR